MDGHDSDEPKQNTTDMAAFVQNLLQQMTVLFLTTIALDEMGNRINELEQSIKDLKEEMGPEESPSPVPASKSKPDDSKPEDSSNTTE
uniref:Heat shock factor binding protein n=1 Tax=Chenopodium quinoa TaxID=63459 RepID=A0A803MPG7_CHEQI